MNTKLDRLLTDSGLTVEYCNDGSIILYHNGESLVHLHQDKMDLICMWVAGWNSANILRGK